MKRAPVIPRHTTHTPVSYTHLDVYKRQHRYRVAPLLVENDELGFPKW